MPVMDEFREEREALKHGTWKQKLSYFIDYYKWHTIITAAVLILIITTAVQIINRKDVGFYVCMLNTAELDAGDYVTAFAEYANIDTNTYDLIFDTSMTINVGEIDQESIAGTQKLMVYIAASELDAMVTDADTIANYANSQYFFDLREILTPEQSERYEPYFYYVDWKAVLERQEASDNYDESYVPSYPDPRKPEEMEQPVPVGIYLEKSELLKSKFYFRSNDVVVSIFQNSTRPETALQFIDYLMLEP